LIIFYWVAGRAVELLEVRWIEWLVYAIIPISVTFIILYRSCWNPEIKGVTQTCSLLLLSCIILGDVLFPFACMRLPPAVIPDDPQLLGTHCID
jgi:hypothetical protein